MLEVRARKLERKGSLTIPIYSRIGRQALSLSQGKAWTAGDGAAPHERKIPSVTVPRHDQTGQSRALDAERRSISASRLPSNGAPQGNQGKQG